MMSLIVYQVTVVCVGAVLAVLAALIFFRRIELQRPTVGTFNGRDIVVLFVFIATLPVLYLAVPHLMLTCFLCLTFASALYIGYRPVLPPGLLCLGIAALLGADIALAAVMNQSVGLWQGYWIANSAMVMLGVAAIANLYIQGGMRLRHVAWFALGLAVYDPLFSFVIPVTDKLAARFDGFALDPSMGFRFGPHIQNIGVGDLLVFTLFVLAAYRGYGRRAAWVCAAAVVVVGGIMPIVVGSLGAGLNPGGGFVIPVQTFFGPVAFLLYLWLRHRGAEAPRWQSAQAAPPVEAIFTSLDDVLGATSIGA
jgi:hypothetical protein